MKFHYFLLFFCCYLAVNGQQISFEQLSVQDGLSQNSVVSIAQDTTGYLWFATQDGLNKYNGQHFQYYPKLFEDVTSDRFSRLGKVYVTQNNQLFIINKQGVLERYNSNSSSFQPIESFILPSTMLEDSQRNFWVGTYGNGLYAVHNTGKDTLQILSGSDVVLPIYSLANKKDDVYVAATEKVFQIDINTFQYESFYYAKAEETINFSSVAINNNDSVFVGSFGFGLFQISEENQLIPFKGFSRKTLPKNLNIQTLLFDSKNRLWIGTYGQGAFLVDFKNETIQNFQVQPRNPKSIHYNDVLCLYEDFTGIVWLGTDGGGLSYYDESLAKFSSLTNAQTPVDVNVDVTRAIAVDTNGDFWIGTSGKGLTHYNPKTNSFKTYKHNTQNPSSIPSDRIMSLKAENEKLWIGFQDEGLSILQSDGNFKNYNQNSNPPLSANTLWCIYKDSENRMWLGSRENGLLQFDEKRGVVKKYLPNYRDTTSLVSDNIRVIEEGSANELWIGTENQGICKFLVKEERFVSYKTETIKNIKSLHFQSPILWIGTNGDGLIAFNTETEETHQFSRENGLPNNVIYSILSEDEHTFWLSSNKGISRFEWHSFADKPNVTNYDTFDGLQGLEFNTGAYFKDENGTFYFGGLQGINWLNPAQLQTNSAKPKTVIYGMDVFETPVNMLPNRTFKYKENTLTFNFASLHYAQPERNQFSYKLENHDENWSQPTLSSFAHYTNLTPGDYTFKVISSNYDGVWNAQPQTYSFAILQPWYWTLWAKIGYALLLILILYAIYNYLKYRLEMKLKLKLEHQETERLKHLDELKTKLYTNISHEFRTPLTLISAPVKQLLKDSKLSEKGKKSVAIIEGSSKRMLNLVNQLLDLSKLEAGNVSLEIKNHNLNAQITQLIEAFSFQAKEKNIQLNTDIETFNNTWYDRDVIEKIISNLLSNAIKYAPKNSEINFKATLKNKSFHIEVSNKNRELSTSDLNKLFDRFYQSNHREGGVGIGLSLVKELVVLTKGRVSAKRIDENRIAFLVTIPIEVKQPLVSKEYSTLENPNSKDESIESIISMEGEIPQILIVEDNLELQNYVASLFTETFNVKTANDGDSGIKKALKTIPDIIISDIMMPKTSGLQLCDTLKNNRLTSHIPIILLTAKSDDNSALQGLQTQADDYITKPFHPEILLQKVKNLVASRRELQKRFANTITLRPKEIAYNKPDELFLKSVQKIIDEFITEPQFNVAKFSEEVGMSRMQLHRKLKALTGLSSTEFIRSQRIKASLPLLKKSDLNISQIAYEVGFNSASYFIKSFKEFKNQTPTEYVENR